ncbi:protein phosphatase 2C [Nitzschia inconspicua]|uniref:Protein phosphatase 2C n=1 Tax=Nitzschia inconspicua TaxID=303405 RepID=A0A9K3LX45_9STRA|nr:protein phosphatase 2C [Nitzschia inconspicua]
MTPFRRGRSSSAAVTMPLTIPEDEEQDDHYNNNNNSFHHNNNNRSINNKTSKNTTTTTGTTIGISTNQSSAWDARRRRKSGSSIPNSNNNHTTINTVINRKKKKQQQRQQQQQQHIPEGEYDPYDSDPGESYRDHCERIKGERTRSCLAMPRFLKEGGGPINFLNNYHNSNSNHNKVGSSSTASSGQDTRDISTAATAPPSPLLSEQDENSPTARHRERYMAHHYPNGMPASLPRDLARVRYSLRTSIGDGSDPQPALQSTHLMERRQLRPNNVHINVSHWSDFGGRNYMEDRYVIEDMGAVQVEVSPVALRAQSSTQEAGVEVTFGGQLGQQQQQRKNRRLKMPLTWLGVFDGHGGDKASQFCADWLSSYVRNEESYPFDLGYSMKNAFTAIDEDFVATGHPDGSTACAATLVGGRRIVCANAGDSRAIVVRRDGTVVRLSRDHKPGMPDETRRISELGGRVIYWGRWRVEGLLAVSRSVGDASLKPYVTAEPEVCEYDIGKDDWFLVMSSDGVWDVMDNEEAAHVVIASSCVMEDGQLKIDTDRFKWAARNLCEHAKSCGSTDNFSVVVVDLKSCGNPQAKAGRYSP